MLHLSRRRASLLQRSLLALALAAASGVSAQSLPAAIELQLPAGSLEQALHALARQSGIQILFASTLTEGRQVSALSGRYAPRQALELLLKGQPLLVVQSQPGIYLLQPAQARSVALEAAAPAPSITTELDQVNVSASTSRIALGKNAMASTISIISRQDIEQQLALGADIPGILASQVAAFAPAREKLSNYGETMRGRSILYMIDGVPQSTPLRDGSRDAHTIDASLIERIEIIHGSNALQGIGGTGGVINIITRKAPSEPGSVYLHSDMAATTAVPQRSDSSGQRVAAVIGARSQQLDLVAGLAYEKQGLFYDGDGKTIGVSSQGEVMDSETISVFAKLGWDFSPGRRLQLSVKRYQLQGQDNYIAVNGDYLNGVPTRSVAGDTPLDPPMNLSRSLTLDYSDNAVLGGQFVAQLFMVDFEGRFGATQWDAYDSSNKLNWDQSQNESDKRGFKLTQNWADIGGSRVDLTLGLDGLREQTRQVMLDSGLDWVPESTYESLSPLLQMQWWPSSQLMLSAGLRYEHGELQVDDYHTLPRYGARLVEGGSPTMSDTLPNFGAVWYLNDALNVYASYSEGYTLADVGRVLRSISTDGQQVDNLVDLSPVVSDNREIGIEYDDGRYSADIAYYISESDLGSVLVFDPGIDAYNVKRQATKVEGLEANAALRFGRGRVGLGYAHASGRYDYDGDNRTDSDLAGVNIAPDRLTAYWEQSWTSAFSTRVQASHAFDRSFARVGSEVADFDGYTTMDLIARYSRVHDVFSLGIQNLTDTQYISYYSQTTPSDSSYFSGRGRVLRLSWLHRF